ncbi:MAG: MFS transporter [Candidatus Micrarchaeaceae archaeon]
MQYKWTVLTNTTLGGLMSSINMTIVLISLPAIFRGLAINPLAPDEFVYLLWILMGYSIVTSTLLVTLGRISDMKGRTKMYTLGFIIFTIGSILLSLIPDNTGNTGALILISFRLFQAVGGALLMVNSTALITDAFGAEERGKALGINSVSSTAGSLIGLIGGGLLANFDWHYIFIVSIPFALAGTIWSILKLKETSPLIKSHIDYYGNLTLGGGLVLIALALTYSIVPYSAFPTGWRNPFVLGGLAIGLALMVVFVYFERRTSSPIFKLHLFRIRPFALGNISGLLSSLSRGAVMFLVVIWLQGIYLPLHGMPISLTPFWAGIYMIPLMLGFVALGPISGWLTDKFGARIFATSGMVIIGVSLLLLASLPYNFNLLEFELILLLNGIGGGMFAAPNTTAIMNATPAIERGSANGMRTTLLNLGQTMSMAIFFTITISIFSIVLPGSLFHEGVTAGLSSSVAKQLSSLSPTGLLFSAFLGIDPIHEFLVSLPANVSSTIAPSVLEKVSATSFLPYAIAPSFMTGLSISLYVSATLVFVGAVLSAFRGRKYIHKQAE